MNFFSLLIALSLITGLWLLLVLASYAAQRYFAQQKNTDTLVQQINHLLPQTQCGHCGFKGCMPYAKAISEGEAINRCPPGGEKTVTAIAQLLNVEAIPLDAPFRPASYAYIREEECIGCTKCIQACPVDAIMGAAKLMHTVIQQECTGCDLCVEPCPVDCIEMRPLPEGRFAVPMLIASDKKVATA